MSNLATVEDMFVRDDDEVQQRKVPVGLYAARTRPMRQPTHGDDLGEANACEILPFVRESR